MENCTGISSRLDSIYKKTTAATKKTSDTQLKSIAVTYLVSFNSHSVATNPASTRGFFSQQFPSTRPIPITISSPCLPPVHYTLTWKRIFTRMLL